MFLEKVTTFAEHFPNTLAELNLRIIEVTDELVETIKHIDLKDGSASQDLFEILQILDYCVHRGKRDLPEDPGPSQANDPKCQVFKTINLKLYNLSTQPIPSYSGNGVFLSTSSIVTLCLLYLIDGVLDDKCHEKLQNVLRTESLSSKTCPFVVWCLLAILKSSITSDFDNSILPAWIAQKKNSDSDSIEERLSKIAINDKFCNYGKIFEVLSKIAWRCALPGKPSFDTFWKLVQHLSWLPNLHLPDISWSIGQTFILDQLVVLLESPKFPTKFVNKLVKLARELRENSSQEKVNPKLGYQMEKFTKASKSLQCLKSFEDGMKTVRNDASKRTEITLLDLFSKCLHLLTTVVYYKAQEKLLAQAKYLCTNLLELGCQSKLEEVIENNIEKVNIILSQHDNMEWLYLLASKCSESLSFDARINCSKILLEEKSYSQAWELLTESLVHIRDEKDKDHAARYASKVQYLLKGLVYDVETRKRFIKFAEQNRSIINQILRINKIESFNDFLFSILAPYPRFIKFKTKIKNIQKVIKYIEKSVQQNLLTECIEKFSKENVGGKQYDIAVAYLSLLSAQNYNKNEIFETTARHANIINYMLLRTVSNPQAKEFYSMFLDCQKLLNLEVKIIYCGRDLADSNESDQAKLLFEILPGLENFDNRKNMFDYLAALEILLSKLLQTDLDLCLVKQKIIEFAVKNKKRLNETLVQSFSIFSRAALLSILKTNPDVLEISVKYKYIKVMGGKKNEEYLWHLLGQYILQITQFQSVPVADAICDSLLEFQWDEKYPTIFIDEYKETVNDHIKRNLFHNDSFLIPFLMMFPNFLNFESKSKFLALMDISEQCAHLEECFSNFEKMQPDILKIIESVCFLINESKDHETTSMKLKPIITKYIGLIVDKVLPMSDPCHFASLEHLLLHNYYKSFNWEQRLSIVQTKLKIGNTGRVTVPIDRENVLGSSYYATSKLTPYEWRMKFIIEIGNEPGVDMGGRLREWFKITKREILNPHLGLFVPAPGDVNSYMINKSSHINPDHLRLFKFIGRFLAKGILENIYFDCPLTKVFYKHILDIPVEHSDFESQDPEVFNSLRFLLNHPIDEAIMDLTFSTEIYHNGALTERELIPNGKNIPVTDDNKHEYVKLISAMKMTESIRPQLDEFLAGFYDVIPKNLIKLFEEKELEKIFCDQSEIDIEDLKKNTVYRHYQESDDVIQWFWKTLRSFDKKSKAKFVLFVTGSSRAPLNGFSRLRSINGIKLFNICEDIWDTERLPTARTCFNQLYLPRYTSYEKLRRKLLLAIRETRGFGTA